MIDYLDYSDYQSSAPYSLPFFIIPIGLIVHHRAYAVKCVPLRKLLQFAGFLQLVHVTFNTAQFLYIG